MENKKRYFESVFRNVKCVKQEESLAEIKIKILKENKKILQLSMQESNENKVGN